jgi:hypothetical protein
MGVIEEEKCANCKAAFSCGAFRGEAENCWCQNLSGTLASPNPDLGCFCPECLPLMIHNQDSVEQQPQTNTESAGKTY